MVLDKITELFGELETKINFVDEINNLFGKTLALDFNSLDFWRIDENKVSEILAFFLDCTFRQKCTRVSHLCWQLISLQTDGLFRSKLYALIKASEILHLGVPINFLSSGQIKASEVKPTPGMSLLHERGFKRFWASF